MALFENCYVLLELKNLPFKEKKRLKLAVTENGGSMSFVVNKQCSLVVTSDVSSLSSNRLRSIQKHQTPVVGVDYVYRCLERGALLPVDEYKLDISSSSSSSTPIFLSLSPPKRNPLSQQVSIVPTSKPVADRSKDQKSIDSGSLTKKAGSQERTGNFLDKFRIYSENDSDLPTYPDNFQVAKYSVFEKVNSCTCFVLELQSFRGEKEQQYRVVRYRKDDIKAESAAVRDQLVFLSSSEEALEVYQALKKQLKAAGLQPRNTLPPQAWDLGSAPLKQLLLEEKLNTGRLSQKVGVFVELLWTEALGCLGNILKVSITSLSLNDVSRAEGLLLQAQKKLRKSSHAEAASLLDEVYTLLPHREPRPPASAKLISQKLDLCQLIRDVLNVSEVTLRSPSPSCLGKYRALRCSIEAVPPSSPEFQAVTSLLQDRKVQIQQVLSVSRGAELQMFKNKLGNVKPLLHSSSPSSFVGILSRGLLLPRVGVEHHGIERTDIGNLGSGIYFSDAMSTSLKYSKPGVTDGSRLLLVCDVALGRCQDIRKKDPSLTQAPEGFHSVHGVCRSPSTHSEFEDDEYVVYSPDQVKLRYVVQFSVDGDQLKEFSPSIDTTAELPQPTSDQVLSSEEDGVGSSKNPLDDVKAGLLDSSGQQLPLQAVHVKCKLMDLLSQVIIFQKYTNQSSVPIEAKYVFPLDDSAAVCGFEAFINGKHVVGQVKEKETAHKEYKQAIEKGHGAYLMDQDAPDVFTISVGNLPPNATVLIKVTFVSELIVRDGCVFFSLPGSVAPWQQSAALNQTTQVTVEKVCVTDQAASMGQFSLDMCIEMPYEITSLQCITHNIKMKRTDCKAVVSVLPDQVMGPDGFQLSVTLSDIHLPRMWVEKHPDKDSQACMLVFYPDFDDSSSSASSELVILLDTSESMRGESLQTARRIALQLLKTLVSSHPSIRLNVILFGSDHSEAFVAAQPLLEGIQQAKKFIMSSPPVGGSTELWRPLRALSLLPPSRGLRNLLLLSDGHIQNADLTLQLLRDNAQHSRLFTCGLSATANRHMLRALAQAGGGAYEFFDTKTKHNWAEKAESQVKRMASPGCSSVSVKWQQFNPTAPPPAQAPTQLPALFNNCHTLVYGFVPHCTQATLLGDLSGQEIRTMVSTSELQKTRGTFLHKLTARAIIRDYEDGSLDTNEAEHEGKKAELKSFIIELSKEFSILSQFTSFVAIEERDSEQTEEGFTDIPKLIAEEDVDLLPYMSWISPQDEGEDEEEEDDSDSDSSAYYLCSSMAPRHGRSYNLDSLNLDLFSSEMETEEMDGSPPDDETTGVSDVDICYSTLSPSYLPTSPGVESPDHVIVCDDLSVFRQTACNSADAVGLSGIERARSIPHDWKSKFVCASPAPPPPPPPHTVTFSAKRSRPNIPVPCLASPLPPTTFMGRPSGQQLSPQHHVLGFARSSPLPPPPKNQSASLPPPPPPPCSIGSFSPLMVPALGSALSFPCLPPHKIQAVSLHPPPPPPHVWSLSDECSPPQAPVHGSALSFPLPSPLKKQSASLTSHLLPKLFSLSRDMPPEFPAKDEVYQIKSLVQASIRPEQEIMEQSLVNLAEDSAVPFFSPTVDAASLTLPPAAEALSGSFEKSQLSLSLPQAPGAPFTASQTPLQIQGSLFGAASHSVSRDAFHTRSLSGLNPIYGGFSFGFVKEASSPLVMPGASRQNDVVSGVPSEQVASQPQTCFGGRAVSFGVSEPVLDGDLPVFKDMTVAHSAEQRSDEEVQLVHQRLEGLVRRYPATAKFKRVHQSGVTKSKAPEETKLKWVKIFQMQHSEGFWECTAELGGLIKVDVDTFANVFLKNKGISSLGVRAHKDILRLVATLLVLQLMRAEKLEEGKLLRTLFCLDDSPQPRSERWKAVKRAVDWACWADREYPCVYSRLEFGWSWESSTRQLLGYERLPSTSPLSGFGTGTPLQVH